MISTRAGLARPSLAWKPTCLLDLRLNYGQFLLDQNEFQRAEAVFAEAIQRAPHSVLAQTGLGLALFQQNDEGAAGRALPHFEAAARLSPDDLIIQQNLTICQNRATFNAQPQAPAGGREH